MIIYYVLLFQIILAGNIASNNCPSSFDITTANLTTQADISFNAKMLQIYNRFRGDSNPQRIQNIIITGDTTSLNNYILSMSYPFIAIGIFFLIVYCIIISCTVCQKKCPPCDSWRRDFTIRPYQKIQLRCVGITSFAFSLILLGVAIYCFVIISYTKNYIAITKCSVYTVLDSVINGDLTNSWGGFTYLTDQIGNISSSLSSSSGNMSTYFPYTNSWLSTQNLNLSTTNLNLYNTYSNSTIATPNYNAYSSSSSSVPTHITPLFISSGLGPNGTANTMVTTIDSALRISEKLTAQAQKTDTSAKILLEQSSLLITNLNLTLNLLSLYNQRLTNLNALIDNFNNDYLEQSSTWGIYLIQGIIGFILAAALVNMIGIVLAHMFDMYNCRMLVHFSWVIFGLMFFGSLITIYVLIPGGIIGTDFCSFYQTMLNNQTAFQSLGGYYSENVFTNIQVCLYGDKNILVNFNANDTINIINNLFQNINIYKNMTDTSNNVYVDLTTAATIISGWVSAVQNYRDGNYIDFNQTISTDSNPNYQIAQLNVASYTGITSQNCVKDYWVYSYNNCTQDLIKYVQGALPDNTTPVCISLNDTATSTSTQIWSQSDLTNRYVNIKDSCPNTYDAVIKYGYAIINYRDSRINLYQSMLNDLNYLSSMYSNYSTNHSIFSSNVNSFLTNVSALNGLINSQISGLNKTKNCSIIASNLQFVNNSFCVNLMNQAYKLAIGFFIFCIILIGAVMTANVFANRYGRIERETKVVPQSSEHVQDKSEDLSSQDND